LQRFEPGLLTLYHWRQMDELTESENDEVLVECSSLPPRLRRDLQAFLENQPEVQRVSPHLHVTDTLVDPETVGLVIPRFDLVVHLAKANSGTVGGTEAQVAALEAKICRWVQENKPRGGKIDYSAGGFTSAI
jgi:hypothetical protein